LLGIRRTEFFIPPPLAATPDTDPLAEAGLQALAAQIQAHVQGEMAWRDDQMTIGKLALQIREPEYRLRRAINGALGFRNFAQFLNRYRLAEVKAALADPTQRDVPILTIALDAGFGSLGPFNRAFRDAEAMTPREYRAKSAG
jgi:AraC-like DNA-binding protein